MKNLGKEIVKGIKNSLSLEGAKESAKNFIAGSSMGVKAARSKNIKNFADKKIHDELSSWNPMDKSMTKIENAKKNLEKSEKSRLKAKGLY